MGREKGARENIFPCLVGEKMGEERKWERKIVWGPAPFSPQLFPPKMGGFWDKFFVPINCPFYVMLFSPSLPFSLLLLLLLLLLFHITQLLSASTLPFSTCLLSSLFLVCQWIFVIIIFVHAFYLYKNSTKQKSKSIHRTL